MIRSIFLQACRLPSRVYRALGARDPAHALGPCMICREPVFKGGGEETMIGDQLVHSSCLLERAKTVNWRATCANEANQLRPLVVQALGHACGHHALLLNLERSHSSPQQCFGVIVELRVALNAVFSDADPHHEKLRHALDLSLQHLKQALSGNPL